jgi:hypothetical protein
MLAAFIQLPDRLAMFAMLGGLALLYVAGRALADALVGPASAAPGSRALGHWIPIAAVALVAIFNRQTDVAIGIVFATSVAAMALGNGVVSYLAPPGSVAHAWRRLWPFALPGAVLALIAGFSGYFKLIHASIFLVQGIAVLSVWKESAPAGSTVANTSLPAPGKFLAARWAYAIPGVGLAIVGAWLVSRATSQASVQIPALSGGVIAAVLLGPALILAMLGTATLLAADGRSGEAITMNTGIALLNLFVLLPVVVALGHVLPGAREYVASIQQPTTMTASLVETITTNAEPIIYPMRVWRVDTVALMVISLLLFPPAVGMWQLGKREGLGLVLGYIAYLMLVTGFAARAY